MKLLLLAIVALTVSHRYLRAIDIQPIVFNNCQTFSNIIADKISNKVICDSFIIILARQLDYYSMQFTDNLLLSLRHPVCK